MTTNQSQIYGSRAAGYGATLLLGLMLSTPAAICLQQRSAIAHIGHDNEFKGDGSKLTQPITVNAATATALGIKAEAISSSTDATKLAIPNSSIIDANGQKLVYVQEGNSYKPIVIQTGKTQGDKIEVTEGNLKPGAMLVMQGGTLLYSQGLRGGATTSPTPLNAAPAAPAPASRMSPVVWIVILAGLGVVGVLAFLRFKKSSRSIFNR